MNDINAVTISGNLTRDPELKATQGGSSILRIGVACNDSRKNKQSGEWEDVPNFIDCVVFGKRAEALSNMLSKGMKVAVNGKLSYSSWETKDGQKRSKIEVIANDVIFMSRGNGTLGAPKTSYEPLAYSAPKKMPTDVYDDDIPF